MTGKEHQLPFANGAHEVFNVMSQITDRLKAYGIGRAFQRMGCAEQLVDRVGIARVLIDSQQVASGAK